MEEKIKEIYNDCWKSYRMYTGDHDMVAYNNRSVELVEKHGKSIFLEKILLAFAPVVNALHAEHRKVVGNG